jgi:hypothetical protein
MTAQATRAVNAAVPIKCVTSDLALTWLPHITSAAVMGWTKPPAGLPGNPVGVWPAGAAAIVTVLGATSKGAEITADVALPPGVILPAAVDMGITMGVAGEPPAAAAEVVVTIKGSPLAA